MSTWLRTPVSPTVSRFVLLSLIVSACGGDSPSEPPTPVPTTIGISGYGGALSFVGATVQLGASVRDQNGSAMTGQTVHWGSSNTAVVAVTGSGLVTATGAGTATVTASAGNASDDLSVKVDPAPSTATVIGGGSQTGTVGRSLPEPLSVEIQDAGGHPVGGENVTFTIVSGGGSVEPSTAVTDAEGQASATWTLGTRTDQPQNLQISSGAVSVDVTASATPDDPSTVEVQSGDGQGGLAGEALADDLTIRVMDQYGNGVPDVAVAWTVDPQDGSFESTSTVTDEDGEASARWILEAHAGEKEASGSVEGLGKVHFHATALPNGVIAGTVTHVSGFLTPPPQPITEAGQASPKAAAQFAPNAGPAQASPPSHRPEFVEGELIVKFRPEAIQAVGGMAATPQTVAAAAAQEQALLSRARRAEGTSRYELMQATGVLRTVRVKVHQGESVEAIAEALRNDPSVEWVERNRWVYESAIPASSGHGSAESRDPKHVLTRNVTPSASTPFVGAPSEPLYPWQAWNYEMLDLPQAWKVTKGDPSIVVAVVDGGIRFDHPDVAANLTSDGYDFVSAGTPYPFCGTGFSSDFAGDGDGPDPDPTIPFVAHFNDALLCFDDISDVGGHGLHVAGTIAGVENGWGGVGVAPGVRIRPVRVLGVSGSGTTFDIAEGIVYAAGLPVNGQQASGPARVINLSLGGPSPSTLQEEAVELADEAGSLIIAAAGNEQTSSPRYPAAYAGALAVSAVGPGSEFADSYSNWGSHVELAAPGGDLARGVGDERWGVFSSVWDFASDAPTFEGINGTSMAAPHVSGVAALLFSQDPSRTNTEVRALLTGYATDLEPAGIDVWYGHGLVNALDALTQGQGIPGQIWVQLRDAQTGAVLDEQRTDGGQFRFDGLPDGEYQVYAGMDEFSDGLIGLPPRPWGAPGGSAKPSSIVIDGAGERGASFSFGLPAESFNDSPEQADLLAVGGYINASLGSGSDQDYYRVLIPEAGTYTFETAGLWSACGFPTGGDTVLDLLDGQGMSIASNDDIDYDALRYCSRITTGLPAGTYFLRVTPWSMLDVAAGWYRVIARRN